MPRGSLLEEAGPEAAEELEPEVIAFNEELRVLSPKTPVTYALIALNVVVFAVMALAGASPRQILQASTPH